MPEFLAETYTPRDAPGTSGAAPGAGDIAWAAEQASGPGAPVRFLGAVIVPGEETGFWLYQAPTAGAVRAAMAAAGLRPERITPAVSLRPPHPAPGTRSPSRPGQAPRSAGQERAGPGDPHHPSSYREGNTTMSSTTPPPQSRRPARLLPGPARPSADHPPHDGRRTPMRALVHRAAVAAGAAAVLLGSAVAAAGPAAATTNPACPTASSSTATSCIYASTGAEQMFTVPAGVTAVTVHAVGAPGGTGGHGGPFTAGGAGGFGASVTATVPLTAGTTTLYVEVGGAGVTAPFGQSAFNGGGTAQGGGGGGGASDVRTVSCGSPCNTADPGSLASRLVVAGGGGGGGVNCTQAPGGTAGDSSATGPGNGGNGQDSSPCATLAGGNGGYDNGTFGGGGNGTSFQPCKGNPGSLGQGGAAPDSCNAAGGGGGGYYGGGGGGDGNTFGGGGGGGSSFWVPAATNTSMSEDSTGTPQVVISWAPPADLLLANAGAPNPVARGQRLTYTITATNTGGQTATGVRVTDHLPATARFGSVSARGCRRLTVTGTAALGGTVLCRARPLAAGGTVTITIMVRPTQAGTLYDTATGTASNVSPADSDDTATATVTVHGA
jgi:uncharacterized repeat protein (TIGR01451 family)